jgi:hypothetical protein
VQRGATLVHKKYIQETPNREKKNISPKIQKNQKNEDYCTPLSMYKGIWTYRSLALPPKSHNIQNSLRFTLQMHHIKHKSDILQTSKMSRLPI